MRVLGLSLVLAGALMASEYSYEISPMIGGVKPEGNLDIDSQTAYGLRFKMNDWDVLGLVPELSFDGTTSTDYDPNVGDTKINRFALNGLYDFKDFSDTLTPYVLLGIGYEDVRDEKNGYESSPYGNYGAGVKWAVYKDIALRAEVKHMLRTEDGGNELYYGLGLSIPFGEKSSDTAVKEEVLAAAVALDSDNDGVIDEKDKCLTTPSGVGVNVDGCALDSDKDGVPDYKDTCLATPTGTKVDTEGCALDNDKDGVADYKDNCPTTPVGRAVNAQGCELDGDSDGVVDTLDKCPATQAGSKVDVNGCSQKIVLEINFETSSAKIDTQKSPQLQKYADFMKENPEYNVSIIGHTDSHGSAAFNKRLSQQRADAVKKDLVNRGVDTSRIETRGYGEEQAIADNTTAEGRAKNRRIEAELKLQK